MNRTTLKPTIGPADQSPEWLEAHRQKLTTTDMAAILGFSEYQQALGVYANKKALVPPFEGNEHTRRGQRYQSVILEDYAEAAPATVYSPLPLYYHAEMPYFGATPDAVASTLTCRDQGLFVPIDRSDECGRAALALKGAYGVEAKLSMSPRVAEQLGEEHTDFIPDAWMVQVQGQMAVMGWQRVDLACLLYGRLRIYKCPRNDDLIAIIESAAKEFWERLQNDDPPEPNWQHASTPTLMKAMHHGGTGISVDLSEQAAELWAARAKAGQAEGEAKKAKEVLDAQFRHLMGDADVGRLPSGQVVKRIFVRAKDVAYHASAYDFWREGK